MADTNLPANYVLFNSYQSKNPVIVLKIIGAPDLLTNRLLQTKILYGDPGITYGDPGVVYGGYRPYSVINPDGSTSSFKDYLDLDGSSLALAQRLEPEQGKASVTTISMAFIDYAGYMTKLVSPGQILPEILLAECEVYLGFAETSFPQDYFKLFRGYISSVVDGAGSVVLQISDPNLKLRTTLFYIQQTELSADVGLTDQVISLVNNSGFFNQIVQPDLVTTFNPAIHTYMQIDSEWIECVPVAQDNEGYILYLNGVIYTAAQGHGGDVSVTFIGGGTAGSEVVTVNGTNVTIKIQNGVSTAQDVFFAIQASYDAQQLLSALVYINTQTTTQSITGQTFLGQNAFNFNVFEGIIYTENQDVTGVTMTYANDGTAGAETVTVSGTDITVHMQTGVSTAQDIYKALTLNGPSVDPLITYKLLPNAGSIVQTDFTSTGMIAGVADTQMAVIQRGAIPGGVNQPTGISGPATHTAGTTVNAGIQVGDPVNSENAMDMALKLMLSGWGGPFISGVPIKSIGIYPDPMPDDTSTQAIVFPEGIDVVDVYGLTLGDYVYVNGSSITDNNFSPNTIIRFGDLDGQSNRIIYCARNYFKENSSVPTVSFRSQYDVYPLGAGLMLSPKDVDVAQHNYIRNTFLNQISGSGLIFFITAQEDSGKDFIQTEIYYPIGAFALTRYGQLSCGYNSPPIANQNITVLNANNVLDPASIVVSRATNNRTFFNEIDFSYAPDDQGNFTKEITSLSAASFNRMGGFTNALPINSRGLPASYPIDQINKYASFLLNRYAFGATIIPLTVNWEAGSVIEVGDIVLMDDTAGILQIANFQTGQRGLGQQLFNVIDRTFDFGQGNATLQLQGNLNFDLTDRFATISPSSVVGIGSTTTAIIIVDSFGALYPGDESKKWANYVGLELLVHSFDYSVSGTCTFLGIDSTNNYQLNVSALGFTPLTGYIVDIVNYSSSADPTVDALYKLMHAHLDPTVFVVTGVDARNLTVSSGDIGKFFVGCVIRVHSYDFSIDSGDLTVTLISGDQITVDSSFGFTPSVGQLIDLIGFPDKGNPYRWI